MKFVPKAYFSILSETDFNQFYKIWCVKQIGTKNLQVKTQNHQNWRKRHTTFFYIFMFLVDVK